VYYLNNRYCFPQKYFLAIGCAAPGSDYPFLVLAGDWVDLARDELTSILILFIAILPAYLYMLFTGSLVVGTIIPWQSSIAAQIGRICPPHRACFTNPRNSGARISPVYALPLQDLRLRAEAALTRKGSVYSKSEHLRDW
jgi:hypothetical protein